MNDQLLPRIHGYPARLIVPGLYGYVSATKWLAELELTTLEAFDAYWVPLGWAKEGPILTQSRIDTPQNGQSVAAGRVPIAGVAWAPDRGITKVEVSVDGGDWLPATLSAPISKATWVQWLVAWDAAAAGPGAHTIEVRATDGTGTVQTADRTPPPPDGARGHHAIQVTVFGLDAQPLPTGRAASAVPNRSSRYSHPDDSTPLRLRSTRPLRRRHDRRARQPDVLHPGPPGRPGRLACVLEKVQVAVLAERLGVAARRARDPRHQPIDQRRAGGSGAARRADQRRLPGDDADARLGRRRGADPRRGARRWRATTRSELDADEAEGDEEEDEGETIDLSSIEGLAGSPAGELLAAFEGVDEDDEDGPDTLRVRLSPAEARSFVNRALTVVAAGRLPCPLCGQPLDPQGHICPRRNGHYVN